MNPISGRRQIKLMILLIPLALIVGCVGNKSLINSNASILIHLSDFDTGKNVDGIQVSILMEDRTPLLYSDDQAYVGFSDMEGRILFEGAPKGKFYLFISATQDRPELDTLIQAGTLLETGITPIEILLERKKTIFIGQILDMEDRKPLSGVEFLLNPDKRAAQSLRDGTFKLELGKINTSISYSYNVSLIGYDQAYEMISTPKVNEVNDLGTIFLQRNYLYRPPDREKEGGTGRESGGSAVAE